ncbi:putative RNA methyltransferase bin3, bin3-type S-adenosyl-L-methionine binding protein [Helianthus annuus]|nr:putative RNA methyltransferase bin3, bin3-type S-adenosyl-L-methionine binding protein [Helianthus annuus]
MEDEEKPQNDSVQAINDNKKRKKQKEVAIFGNYRNYYGYRIDQGLEEDPRIKIMRKEWFEGKSCLDIGCNSGLITITIAKKFGCQKIVGIDIDSARIEDAHWNLRRIVKMSESKKHPKVDKSNGAETNNITNDVADKTGRVELSGNYSTSQLFERVSFWKENFIFGSSTPRDNVYDTILCLSVSKWIHLNWGDEGLITLLSKVWRLLKPDGVSILEPQPWKSYISCRQVSEVASTNYKNLTIFPQQFQEILLDKIGFRKIENLSSSLTGSKTGFNRPIFALWK